MTSITDATRWAAVPNGDDGLPATLDGAAGRAPEQEDDMPTTPAAPERTCHGVREDEGARHVRVVAPGPADPGRLDWFTSAVLPGGGQRVRICRCARSTPTEAVELDRGTSALLLAALGDLARVDPAVSWPAARRAVLRAFWRVLKGHDPA